MDQGIREGYEASRKIDGEPVRSVCYVPYTSLYFNTLGEVVACCKNQSYVLDPDKAEEKRLSGMAIAWLTEAE